MKNEKTTMPWHRRADLRLLIGTLFGGGTAATFWHVWSPGYGILLGLCVAEAVFTLLTWVSLWNLNAKETEKHAKTDLPGRVVLHTLLIVAALASLLGLVWLFTSTTESRLADTGIALLCAVCSWLTIHTLYALRYAREYYLHQGGIDFHSTEKPQYSDFVYIAFTVGMSFAISDTDLGSSHIRRIAIFHAMLAYLFGTVIVAATINIMASLVGSPTP